MTTCPIDDKFDITLSTDQVGKAAFAAQGRVYNKRTGKATEIRVRAEGRTAWKAQEKAIAKARQRLLEAV